MPRSYGGAREVVGAMFTTVQRLRQTLYAVQSLEHADLALWFGRNHGWSWLEQVPVPAMGLPGVEWREGCSHCGSLDHATCDKPQAKFVPEPPSVPVPSAASTNATHGPHPHSYAPLRYIDPDEMRELDEIARQYPEWVALARSGCASPIDACRAVRDQLLVQAKQKERAS